MVEWCSFSPAYCVCSTVSDLPRCATQLCVCYQTTLVINTIVIPYIIYLTVAVTGMYGVYRECGMWFVCLFPDCRNCCLSATTLIQTWEHQLHSCASVSHVHTPHIAHTTQYDCSQVSFIPPSFLTAPCLQYVYIDVFRLYIFHILHHEHCRFLCCVKDSERGGVVCIGWGQVKTCWLYLLLPDWTPVICVYNAVIGNLQDIPVEIWQYLEAICLEGYCLAANSLVYGYDVFKFDYLTAPPLALVKPGQATAHDRETR